VLGVPQACVAAERAKERLLERVLGLGARKPPREEGEDLVPVRLVEALEGRQGHGVHHSL
jgi:hypothetical protein